MKYLLDCDFVIFDNEPMFDSEPEFAFPVPPVSPVRGRRPWRTVAGRLLLCAMGNWVVSFLIGDLFCPKHTFLVRY